MAQSETYNYIKEKLDYRIKTNTEQKEFIIKRISELDNEKLALDSAITSIDKVVFEQLNNVNDKLKDVETAYQNRIDVNTCRTDLFWKRIGVSTEANLSGFYYVHTYVCDRTSPVGYASSVTYISETSGNTTTINSGLLAYEFKNLYGIRYYYEPYEEDTVDSFLTSFIGTVGTGSSIVTALSSVDSSVLNNVKVEQFLNCKKDGVFASQSNKIVGIGTTIADLSVINSGFSTESTVYTFTLQFSSLDSVSAPESDGSFVEFEVLKSVEEVGNISISFGTNPYSPQTIGITNSSEYGKGVKVEFTNEGWPSATQSWRPELNGLDLGSGKIIQPQVSAGKVNYNIGFTKKPQKLVGGNWVDASFGDIGYLYFTGTVFGLPDTARVVDMGSCSTEQNAINEAINVANQYESEISSDISTINKRMEISTALRKERNNINIQIWGKRQLIGKLDEETTQSNNAISFLNDDSIIGIIT